MARHNGLEDGKCFNCCSLLHRYVDADEKPVMEEMIENIRTSFGEVIGRSEWMDEDTR